MSQREIYMNRSRTPNRVKILFPSVGKEDDLMESAHFYNIHPSLLMHVGLMLPLPRMVAHQTDRQRAWSASLPAFVKETLARAARHCPADVCASPAGFFLSVVVCISRQF